MASRFIPLGYLTALILGPALILAQQPQEPAPQAKSASSRVRIVPQSSDERLEDIQESADGTRLITHDRGFAPRLWDLKSLKLLKVLGGSADSVSQVAFSPDGKHILCRAETEFVLWDAKYAALVGMQLAPKGDRYTSAAFSPDSNLIAFGTQKGMVILFDPKDPKNPRALTGHKSTQEGLDPFVRWVEFSPDGKKLVSTSVDKTARIWDVANGKAMHVLEGHEHIPQWAHFSRDGKYVVTTTLDHKAHLFDVNTGRSIWRKAHTIGPKGISGSTHMASFFVGAKEQLVLVAGEDGTMALLNPPDGKLVRELKGHKAALREIRVSLDGTKVATYGDDEKLGIWDVESGKELPPIERSGQETAGEFSRDGKTWWLGHMDGHITQHDVATGKSRSSVLSSVQTMYGALPMPSGGRVWTYLNSWQVFWNPAAPKEFYSQKKVMRAPEIAPNGQRVIIYRSEQEYPDLLMGPNDNWGQMAFKNQSGYRFAPDSTMFVSWRDDGTATVWNAVDGKEVKSWKWEKEWAFTACAMAPHDKLVASIGNEGGGFLFHWAYETGNAGNVLRLKCGKPLDVTYSRDGSKILVVGEKGLEAFDTKTGDSLYFSERTSTSPFATRLVLTPDGSAVISIGYYLTTAWETATGKELLSTRSRGLLVNHNNRISPDGKLLVTHEENIVQIWDIHSGKSVMFEVLSDAVHSAAFTDDGKRLITADPTEGMTIFEIAGGRLRRVGNFVVMKSGHWLAYDTEGRFDATDPDEADGAHFVLEWDGGLEPIALSQLKTLFYEPGLLAKMLGHDKEPARAVPDLQKLRLFPSVSLSPSASNPMQLNVELEERDEGGIGRVEVSINGKQVLVRRGTGLFKLDVNDYKQFLLPATHLPMGQGNVVQVRAGNETGTLMSPPATADIGAPKDLQVPKVNIHALCVGVGDYVGQQGDLSAPPSDARAMGQAIEDVGERLLPGQVHVTVLETDSKDVELQPSRTKIASWFDELAKKATSSDVVFVFFAGHGVSRIGEQSGYFFLTPEANPNEVNALSVSTQTISGEDLKAMLGKVAANKQIVILDTCHSGAASKSLLEADRSISGDYQRAWESIRDTTGVWMLAGSAADQLSYESANVEHGMLTYALLEAIDKASPEGLRKGSGEELFVDVERWLNYAATRVESLKNEVGLKGVQRPEFRRAKAGQSFDIGVTSPEKRGKIGLRPPKPVVIMGNFSMDEEDPAGLEGPIRSTFKDSVDLKPWFEVAKHPGVYRIAGTYSLEGDAIKLKVFLQQFDSDQNRKTVETFDLSGTKGDLPRLALELRREVEARVKKLEESKAKPPGT